MGLLSWLRGDGWNYEKVGKSLKEIFEEHKKDTESRITTLEEKIEKLLKLNTEFINATAESIEQRPIISLEKIEKQFEKYREKRNNDLKIQNNNFRLLNEKIKNQNTRIEALIELIADSSEDNESINFFDKKMNLGSIFRMKNQNKAALIAIVYMMKKYFDEKGQRV